MKPIRTVRDPLSSRPIDCLKVIGIHGRIAEYIIRGCGFFTVCPPQERHDLRTGTGFVWTKMRSIHTVGDSERNRPFYRIIVICIGWNIRKRTRGIHCGAAEITPQKQQYVLKTEQRFGKVIYNLYICQRKKLNNEYSLSIIKRYCIKTQWTR